MITTSTGAKKLESSDNWREIFPNPGTSAAGAHNASVDAQDRIQAEVAPIINGKRCSLGAASGDYVLLRNSTIAGKTDGAYVAAKAIPANTDLDSTYLGSAITGGLVNELNNKIIQYPTRQTNITIPVGSVSGDATIQFSGANNYRWFATIQAASSGDAYSGIFIEYVVAGGTGINVSVNRAPRNDTSTAITVNVYVFGVPNA